MPRAYRHYIPGCVWHITHRCHKQEFLLKFDKDRKRWRHWLFEAKKRYGLCVLNYIATSNHTHTILLQILNEASHAPRSNKASSIIAEQVFRFIGEHDPEPISTTSIAHELHRNPDYIGRCFKTAHSCTITEEINRRRLLETEKMLIDNNFLSI